MNAESDKIRESLVDQLSSFEDRLDNKIDDVKMLSEIQDGIVRLLRDTGGSEAEIRGVLQDRYDSGELRKETFQLVKSMLDGYVTDQVPTISAIPETPAQPQAAPTVREVRPDNLDTVAPRDEDPMASTMVIATVDSIKPESADNRVQVGSVLLPGAAWVRSIRRWTGGSRKPATIRPGSRSKCCRRNCPAADKLCGHFNRKPPRGAA
jgi:hypothetical protein